ncbi:hypothetical protein PHAVU_006G174000 [Phaseolus vulgaris]|uniref:Uncharacterized protein n=1 Tax=Phaseolus vulgaris TaxID=3885 RepID=V7BTX6_PHAVU|nr:hypothetical protein PHAVU_006G174000g [Phaseolus vulgaris]ESW20016.1 hypothetical protein PHAVU_006G174000g [Phaseolus vulgaris]
MMQNQSKQVTSLTTTRLSPLAKPFTLNRSTLQPCLSSLFAGYPFLELPKESDFDGFGEDFSLPIYSPLGHGKQGEDSHESLFAKGSDVADSTMFKKGKQAVHGLSPCLTESAGTGTIVAEDLLLNSKGTILVDDESGTFPLSNCKVSPVKSLTTDMSSAKNTYLDQSSKTLVENDSDVDSPCWKGTRAFCQTSIENSGSVQINNVEKATEKHNSLNPLAPQFFPRIAYVKDDFGSSNSSSPVATNFFSGEHMLMKTVMAESPVELNMGIELQPSSNTRGKEKAINMINDPKNSYVDPVLNLHCKVTKSSSKEDCSMSKGKPEAVVDADNFVKGATKSSSPISTLASSSSSSSSGVAVVTDLMKTFEGVSKSLSKSPKPDVGMVVSAIHVLSELLVQTSMDGVGSNNEHGHDEIMIQQTINNLNDFRTKRCVQRIPTLKSTPVDHPSCHNRPLELPKGLEMTSIETLNDPNKLHPQNDYTKKKTVFKMFGQSGKSFFAPSSDKGNEIAQLQVIRRSLGKTLDFDKHMHPEALLFLNLWLDSEAERCYSKYKTHHCLMEAGLDVNCTTVANTL